MLSHLNSVPWKFIQDTPAGDTGGQKHENILSCVATANQIKGYFIIPGNKQRIFYNIREQAKKVPLCTSIQPLANNWATKKHEYNLSELPIVQIEVNLDQIKINSVCNSFSPPHVHRQHAKNWRYGKWHFPSSCLYICWEKNVKQISANIEIVGWEKEDCGKQTMPLLWLCLKENQTKCNL